MFGAQADHTFMNVLAVPAPELPECECVADSWHCGPQKVAIEHLLHLPVARRPQTRQRPSLCKEARLALYRQISIDRRRPACASATLAMQLLYLRCRECLLELGGSALLNEAAMEEPGTQ